MAVTKIRKISSWTLLVLAAISVVIIALFFFGGKVDPTAANPEPVFTTALLYWVYFIFAAAVVALLLFGLSKFVAQLKSNPKGAITSLVIAILFVALLLVTYAIGSTDKLPLGSSFAEYNTPFWLKLSDMWLYSTYTLVALAIVGIIWGGVKSLAKK